jgi:hypothetical protein
LARPMISQTINHTANEKRIGIFLPNKTISAHDLNKTAWNRIMEYWNVGIMGPDSNFPSFQYSILQTYRFSICHISSTVSK